MKNGSINVTDEDLEAIINGLYTPSPTVIIGKTSGNPGALAAVPVIVKNNSGFDKLELEMSYDTSVFTYKEVYSNIVASVNAEYTDKVKLSISSSNVINDSNNLCYVVFEVSPEAELGDYEFKIDPVSLSLGGKKCDYNKVNGMISLVEGEIEGESPEMLYENTILYKAYSDHVLITGYQPDVNEDGEEIGEVTIPATIDGLPVTEIDEWAFSFESGLKSVSLPDSITKIGDGAFLFCESLTTVNIPKNIVTIGADAFNMCSAVPSFTVPASTKNIGVNAFLDCQEVKVNSGNKSFTVDNNVLLTADKTRLLQFLNRTAEEYTVPTTVKVIDEYAFYNMTSLKKVVLPDSITKIDVGTFQGCSSLTDAAIPETVTEICESAYEGTAISSIDIPASVVSIGEGAFAVCESLKTINVADGNKNYSDVNGILFDKNNETLIRVPIGMGISSYDVPASVKTIEANAFDNIASLTEVKIPSSVNTIGECAFENCSKLASVTISGSKTEIEGLDWTISNGSTEEGDAVFSGVIYGKEGSPAQLFADEYEYKFEVYGDGKDVLYGDANCDETVNISDAVLIMQAVVNSDKYGVGGSSPEAMTERGRINADCYKPGTDLTSRDALSIQLLLLESIPSLPEE